MIFVTVVLSSLIFFGIYGLGLIISKEEVAMEVLNGVLRKIKLKKRS